jgi:hypothetical protein
VIENYINAVNDRCVPSAWTKDADSILANSAHPKNRNIQDGSVTRPSALSAK